MKPSFLSVALITPLVLFFVTRALINDTVPQDVQPVEAAEANPAQLDPARHLAGVVARTVAMALAIGAFWSVYKRAFPLQMDRWAIIAGVAGSVLWIGICELHLEPRILSAVGLPDSWLGFRSTVNPFTLYPDMSERAAFLVFRFALLAVLVPIAEELFLRGFLMRMVDAEHWSELPLQQIGRNGLIAGTMYGILSHPAEFITAGIWFTMISILMVRTGRFWNCVAAHAITNLILGIYILITGSWYLW